VNRRLGSLVALVGLLVAAACSGGETRETLAPAEGGGRVELVTLGGSETSGADLDFPAVVRDRWTQRLYRDALPTRAVHVNLDQSERLVHDGVDAQLPLALRAKPTIATVWFGPDDEAVDTPIESFTVDLEAVIRGLMDSGAEVFVATETGTRYDQGIDTIVSAEGATPVPVTDLSDPLGPAGHADAAERFGAAIGEVS